MTHETLYAWMMTFMLLHLWTQREAFSSDHCTSSEDMEAALSAKARPEPLAFSGSTQVTVSFTPSSPSVESTRARAGISPFRKPSPVELTRSRAGNFALFVQSSVDSMGGRAGISPFCGLTSVDLMRSKAENSPFCGQSCVEYTGARAGIPPLCGQSSLEFTRGGRAGIWPFGGLSSPVEVGRRGANVSPLSGTGFYCSVVLKSRAAEQRRSRMSKTYHCIVRGRDNAILETEGSGLLFSSPNAARLSINVGQLKDTGRVLKRAVNQTLKILQTSGLGRLSWSPLPPFVGSGGGGGGPDNSNGTPKADVRSLYYQWFPTMKRTGIAFFISSALIALLIVSGPTNSALQPAWALTQENLVFLEAWRTVDRAYVDKSFNGQSWFRYREDALRREPMRTRQETYDAIRKMLATLDDPFTRFLEPEKFKSLKSGTNGALTGVGLEVGFDVSTGGTSEDLVVVTPILGGPAGRAGIVPGDVILAIDGVSTQGMGLYDAARRLQGPLNSEVELTLLNKANTMPKTVSVLREKVTLNPVSWKLCDISKADQYPTKLGYIRLSTFNQNSTRAVKAAIENLRDKGATSFVLDIRNNSGGLFPAGVEIAKMWLEKGIIVYITDSLGVRDIYETDGEGAIATTEPLTVLVNKGTASASEILAGALKDNKRAIIVGETTFGKGRIQSVFQLSDGSGMAVTVARYETPAHINIDKVGIIPDHPLSAGVLPMEEEGLCSYLQDPSSAFIVP